MKEQGFPARLEEIERMLVFVTSAAVAAGITGKRLLELQLAFEELAANICSYAYARGDGDVVVGVREGEGEIAVTLEDRGEPFDPLEVPEPDIGVPLEQRQVGGMGIFLARRLASEITYRREGGRNVLRLVVKNVGASRS